MPDPLLHYSYSLLLAKSQGLPSMQALLVAVAGVAPDLDIIVNHHRGFTHSLSVSQTILAAALATESRLAVLAALLYLLHNLIDLFDSPTPALWPLMSKKY